MPQKNATVAVFDTHTAAEAAIRQLQKAGYDMRKVSIVARDFQTNEHVVGYYTAGDRIKYWGKLGALWGGLWGLLVGWAFFLMPGLGPVAVAGPLGAWIIGALENAAIFGGLSALGAALYSLGIPKESVLKYEMALKADKFLVVAHGAAEEVERAQGILNAAGAMKSAA